MVFEREGVDAPAEPLLDPNATPYTGTVQSSMTTGGAFALLLEYPMLVFGCMSNHFCEYFYFVLALNSGGNVDVIMSF